MRVTHAQYADPATLDSEAATQLWQELSSHVRGLPGNQSYTRGLDRASGRTIAISIWDTEEHAKALSSTSDFRVETSSSRHADRTIRLLRGESLGAGGRRHAASEGACASPAQPVPREFGLATCARFA